MTNIALSIGLILFISLSAVSPAEPTIKPTAIKIKAKPIRHFDPSDPSRRCFGALEFRGGLVLTSRYKLFGGISAIRMRQDGANFLALSDRGLWLLGRIIYDGSRPAGIKDATMAPMLDANGMPADDWDAESLAEAGRDVYVGIERLNAILSFDFAGKGLMARGEPIAIPSGIRDLPSNKGLEALVYESGNLPLRGTLVALSERGLDESGNLKAFLIGGETPGAFSIRRTQAFDISDAALLPDGDLLILERKFSSMEGLSIRIRRIRRGDIKPDSVLDGQVLFGADARNEIDNMEGLGVHQTRAGEIILTMVSDDNFSPAQRTLLLQFALSEKQTNPGGIHQGKTD